MQHERAGRHIPAFLISSITAECNLNCNGCYALANQSCRDQTDQEIMPAEKWNDIFFQARKIGVSFILIAGGEPLIRKDVIKYAAGRGFLHINADGGAEPCTFSPYSDISVRDHSLLEVLDSKLFINLRDSGMLIGEHRGGCLLFEKEEYVKDFLSKGTYRRPGGCS